MKERRFKVGDRVVGVGKYDCKNIDGLKGRVLGEIPNWCGDYPVEFDKDINGHDCGELGKSRHCWWVREDHLKLATNETIVIYRKGDEVIALDKSTGKKATAKCSPADTFDFNTGAKLAFARLMGIGEVKEETKSYNGKIIFTKCDESFTPHKIYEIVDGKITRNDGDVLPYAKAFKSIDDVRNYFGDKSTGGYCGKWYDRNNPNEFIEVVE